MIGYDFCLVRNIIGKLKKKRKPNRKRIWFLYRNVIGYDRIWFLFALEYTNIIKGKGNLIEIEKKTVKGTPDSHLVIKILFNYRDEIC